MGANPRSPAPKASPVGNTVPIDDVCTLAANRAGNRLANFCQVVDSSAATCALLRQIGQRPIRLSVVGSSLADAQWSSFTMGMQTAGALPPFTLRRDASLLDDLSFDFVLLDGHGDPGQTSPHASCMAALDVWWAKVRPGGMLAGRDYVQSPGVKAAVDRFVAANSLTRAFRVLGGSWAVHKSVSIDAMYCINLPSRADRRRNVEEQFHKAGIADRVEFFDGIDGKSIKHPSLISNGQAGCASSHLAVLAKAKAAGVKHALVFEDDVLLPANFEEEFRASLTRCPATYDFFYAGVFCAPKWGNYLHRFDDRISRAGNVYGSFACLVNLDIEPRMRAEVGPLRIWNDNFRKNKVQPQGHCFVCTPYLAGHATGYSNVSGNHTDTSACQQYIWR